MGPELDNEAQKPKWNWEAIAPPGLPSFASLKRMIEEGLPGVKVELVPNPARPEQSSILLPTQFAVQVATFLRDDPRLLLDYCSNVSGVDWLDREITESVLEKVEINGQVEERLQETVRHIPGYLEVVYHVYSVRKRAGPLVLRQRTVDRQTNVHVASLTPVWRSAEFQEREVYDLFGVIFDGHPDLRRILMWDEFEDFPMRKDYVEPDDYEYEPTPHGRVLERARRHYPRQ